MRRSFDFLFDFLIRVQFPFRNQVLAQQHHVNHSADGQRNTDLGKFKEAKGLEAGRTQRTGSDNIGRRTYQCDDTADAAGKGQRHQFAGRGNLRRCAYAQYYRHQAGSRTGVGQYGRQRRRNQHNAQHQAVFTGTGDFYDGLADGLCQTGVEHCRTNHEHAGEQNYCRVR